MKLTAKNIGIMGTGSNIYTNVMRHSCGDYFIVTYGPAPAKLWRYHTKTGEMESVMSLGEYQYRGLAESDDGNVYVGTSYKGHVYKYNPVTGETRDLGIPVPEDFCNYTGSSHAVHNLIHVGPDLLMGNRGIGLFLLNTKTDTFHPFGALVGNNRTNGGYPAGFGIYDIVPRSDGTFWLLSNRLIGLADPKTETVEVIADMAEREYYCYGTFTASGMPVSDDLYINVYTRYSGGAITCPFWKIDASTFEVTALKTLSTNKNLQKMVRWVEKDGRRQILVDGEWEGTPACYFYDPIADEVTGHICRTITQDTSLLNNPNSILFYDSFHIFETDLETGVTVQFAENPTPLECRSIAVREDGLLAVDTYDNAHCFTLDQKTGKRTDHGKVNPEDHRSNYGPAVLVGDYFIANHGESDPSNSLWMTNISDNTHCRIGHCAIDLAVMETGTVVGKFGHDAPHYIFDPQICWTHKQRSEYGELFLYTPGDKEVRPTGKFVRAMCPGPDNLLFVSDGYKLMLYNPETGETLASGELETEIKFVTYDAARKNAYVYTYNGFVMAMTVEGNRITSKYIGNRFTDCSRGFFVLPVSGALVMLNDDRYIIWDGENRHSGDLPVALPCAGPAVAPNEDAFYFVDREVIKYSLTEE